MIRLLLFLKEGFIGLRRARLAATISIISLALALTLIGIFVLTGLNLKDVVFRFYKEIEIEAFLDPSLSQEQIQGLQKKIQEIPQISAILFISREQALQEFQKIFGEDLRTVLQDNPLPPSFRIILKSSYSDPMIANGIAQQISQLSGVEEIIYQKEIIQFLHKYLKLGITITGIIAFILLFVITILVFNTIRLTIHARRTIIQIMKLVGATNFFIKSPFIVEGILQGIIGGTLSVALIWGISTIVRNMIFTELLVENYLYGVLLGLGIVLGWIGSYFSVNKYLVD